MAWVSLGISLGLRPWEIPRETHAMPRSDEKSITTQFYPEFPIFRYPKRYTVSGQKDDSEAKISKILLF